MLCCCLVAVSMQVLTNVCISLTIFLDEDVLIGDYGEVLWLDSSGNVAARSGGGGFGDFTDGNVRNIRTLSVVWPALISADGITTNFFDSGKERQI